jgi:predicted RNA-binding Zn-ribbon protein involved in translation (DUF1610 family)
MSKNITNLIFNEVTRTNRNSINNIKKALKESEEVVEEENDIEEVPYDDTTEKFCPRCGKTYTDFPAISRYDNETYICPDCGVEEAMINYTHGKLTDPHVYMKEEVNIESPTAEDIENDDKNIDNAKRKEIEDKIGELKQALDDGSISEDEREAMEDEIKELEAMLESVSANKAKILTEAPEDEEFEVSEDDEELPIDEPIETPEEDINTDEEMSDEEYKDEIEDDEEDTIEDDVEEPFYATIPEFDELRDILPDLDYRLFLINDNMVCIGRLNGPDIEFLTSNRPENTDTEPSEQNEKAEEIENKADEDGEQAFEYKWIKAPETFDKFLNQVNVVYLSPDMSDEEKEQYAGIEASHESVLDFLMNELPEDKREEHENEEAAEDLEEIPSEEHIEEPIEEPINTEEEISDEENPDSEETNKDEEEEE